MRSRTWVRWGAVVSAATILVAGCSGGGGGAGAKRTTLGSALGIDEVPDLTAIQRQSQELVAKCMNDAGWEYLPVQYPDQTVINNPSEDDELARIKLEGLGVAYALLNDPATSSIYDGLWADFVNPNDPYIATLSEDEKTAYQDSLDGTAEEQAATMTTTSQFDPETGTESGMVGSRSGCSGEADAAVASSDGSQTPEEVAAIRGYWNDLQTRFQADPRTIKLGERWVSCMKDSGYDYESPDTFQAAARAEFSAKASDIVGDAAMSSPTADWTPDQLDEFLATASPEEINALTNPQRDLSADQRTQLEALLSQEIAVAVADHECTASLKDESAAIYADVEEQYALEHQDELAALAASMAGDK